MRKNKTNQVFDRILNYIDNKIKTDSEIFVKKNELDEFYNLTDFLITKHKDFEIESMSSKSLIFTLINKIEKLENMIYKIKDDKKL